jgi:hypothetical protein
VSGVRLHHHTKRNTIVEIPHPGRSTAHGPKIYRLTFDQDGDTIVSPTVFARVMEAFALLNLPPTFMVLNEVSEPPALIINFNRADERPIHREHQYG